MTCPNCDKLHAALATATARVQSEEFYNLMQEYRHAPVTDQEAVCKAFKAVKDWLAAEPNQGASGEGETQADKAKGGGCEPLPRPTPAEPKEQG